MQFVRVQDVALTREAVSLLAAIEESLDARDRHADAVGVVAVEGERLADEARVDALKAFGRRADLDAVPRRAALGRAIAQAFKTAAAAPA
jgi:hypothetical protein